MKIKILLTTLLPALWMTNLIQGAVSISAIAIPATRSYVTPNGSAVPDTAVFAYGKFDISAFDLLDTNSQKDIQALADLFNSYGSFNFSSGNLFVNNAPLTGGSEGEQLFAFVTDSADLTSATAFGLFSSTNSLWKYPPDPGLANLLPTLVDIALVGSIDDLGGKLFLEPVGISVIPEPAFFVFALPVFALAIGAMRRRR